jgi:hypothetical protein
VSLKNLTMIIVFTQKLKDVKGDQYGRTTIKVVHLLYEAG